MQLVEFPTSPLHNLTYYKLVNELLVKPAQIKEIIDDLSLADSATLQFDWRFWARPSQTPPSWDWRVWFLKGGRGSGKALALDTLVPTINGMVTMNTISVGDIVFDEKGNTCTVTAVHPVLFDRPCYKVTFSDGTEIVADEDHLWATETKSYRRSKAKFKHPEIVTTNQIRETIRSDNEVNHSIHTVRPLNIPERELILHPYALGVWLGDGIPGTPGIKCSPRDIDGIITNLHGARVPCTISRQQPNGYVVTLYDKRSSYTDSVTGHTAYRDTIRTDLSDIGVLHKKRIPREYLRASYTQRLDLLMGLMDARGYTDPSRFTCEYMTENSTLLLDMYDLICSLGFKAHVREDHNEHAERWRVIFAANIPVFKLPRKAYVQHRSESRYALRQHRRYILKVEPVPSVPVRCIEVDSPSRLFCVTRSFVATHNTWVGANQMNEWAKSFMRLALVGRTAADVRDTMIEGDSGLIAMSPPWFMPKYEAAKRKVTWPNGAFALCFSADEPNLLRGPQFEKAWCDELAAWRKLQEAWNNLMFGLRLGRSPQCVVTTTPRPLDVIKKILKQRTTEVTTETTYANLDNLAEQWAQEIITAYEGTRLGRQELRGEVLDDNPNALWKTAIIDKYRINQFPTLDSVVVAVDPSVADASRIDADPDTVAECGIIVGGRKGRKFDKNAHAYVIDDMTLQGKPEIWADQVVAAYHKYSADKVVAEANNGGALVRAVIQAVDPNVPVELVHASRGKKTRAEPVSTLYEAGRVHHSQNFVELEQELTEWEPGLKSPNRLDANVWLITSLMLGDTEPGRPFSSAAQ